MAFNNAVTLIGNIGSEAEIIETESTTFAAVSIATTDSYKDAETEEWVEQSSIWHKVITFNPKLITILKSLKTGARLQIIGSLSYRPHKVSTHDHDGVVKEFDIMQASVIARKIELAPLPKKSKINQ